MDHQCCPGSKLLRKGILEIYSCSSFGKEVEIWTDEFKGSRAKGHKNYIKQTRNRLKYC